MEFEFLIDNVLQKIFLEIKDGRYVFSDSETDHDADIRYVSPNQISILIDGVSHRIFVARDGEALYVFFDGRQFIIKEPTEDAEGIREGEERTPEGTLMVKAPMPGKVIKVIVAENEKVRKNQTLAIVEAMKMENEIKSSVDGAVKAIHIAAGDLVDSDMPLIELEPV